jgi:hypothetical protein
VLWLKVFSNQPVLGALAIDGSALAIDGLTPVTVRFGCAIDTLWCIVSVKAESGNERIDGQAADDASESGGENIGDNTGELMDGETADRDDETGDGKG